MPEDIYIDILKPMRTADFDPNYWPDQPASEYVIVLGPKGLCGYDLTDPSIPLPRFRSLTIQEPPHA